MILFTKAFMASDNVELCKRGWPCSSNLIVVSPQLQGFVCLRYNRIDLAAVHPLSSNKMHALTTLPFSPIHGGFIE